MTKIAIIGAGLSGLVLANQLRAKFEITLFEKARGVSGRMSTRYATPYEFDHGAQYFTARSEEFLNWLEDHVADGVVSLWEADIALIGDQPPVSPIKFVSAPRMNSLCKTLIEGLDIQLGTRVAAINGHERGWHLSGENGEDLGRFDWVISTAPAPQTSAVLPREFTDRPALDTVIMQGCFSVMLGFETLPHLPWQAARVAGEPVGWMAVNSAKPGRKTAGSVVIQSTNDWAEAHLEDDRAEVEGKLIACAEQLTGVPLSNADHTATHHWRYAATASPAGKPFLIDEPQQLAACGDWCIGNKVEAAFESAMALATHFRSIPTS